MSRRIYPTLVNTAENLTEAELCVAPELPTLVALDASLMATLNLLDHPTPFLGYFMPKERFLQDGVDDHLARAICILANALRGNLAAYYAAVQDSCEDETDENEIEF